jgi:hypothetical protein
MVNDTAITRPVAELRPGDRIVSYVLAPRSVLVTAAPVVDADGDDTAHHRVLIDVEVQGHGSWDADDLASTGAETHQFLSINPTPRYRLLYLPDAVVTVTPPAEAEAWAATEEAWRLEPARRAEARGHTVAYDGVRQERFTCTRCDRAALRAGATIYGSAIDVDCDGRTGS